MTDLPTLIVDDDPVDYMFGPWRPDGVEAVVNHVIPEIVNGFGRAVTTANVPVYRRREKRMVWKFVGYEERTVES